MRRWFSSSVVSGEDGSVSLSASQLMIVRWILSPSSCNCCVLFLGLPIDTVHRVRFSNELVAVAPFSPASADGKKRGGKLGPEETVVDSWSRCILAASDFYFGGSPLKTMRSAEPI